MEDSTLFYLTRKPPRLAQTGAANPANSSPAATLAQAATTEFRIASMATVSPGGNQGLRQCVSRLERALEPSVMAFQLWRMSCGPSENGRGLQEPEVGYESINERG